MFSQSGQELMNGSVTNNIALQNKVRQCYQADPRPAVMGLDAEPDFTNCTNMFLDQHLYCCVLGYNQGLELLHRCYSCIISPDCRDN